MWVTGNPSQMSLPYFKTVSTWLSKAEAHSSLTIQTHCQTTSRPLAKPQKNYHAIYTFFLSRFNRDFGLDLTNFSVTLMISQCLSATLIQCRHTFYIVGSLDLSSPRPLSCMSLTLSLSPSFLFCLLSYPLKIRVNVQKYYLKQKLSESCFSLSFEAHLFISLPDSSPTGLLLRLHPSPRYDPLVWMPAAAHK